MKKVKHTSLDFVQIVETPTNVISIGDRGEHYTFACEHDRVLRLEFDDVEQDCGSEYHMFDFTHARKILDFVETCGDEDILVHCHAGVSRSAAVAQFLSDKLGYVLDLSYPSCKDTSCMNAEVYRILRVLHVDRMMVPTMLRAAVMQQVEEE